MAEQIIITFPPVIDDETVMPVVCCDVDARLPLCPAGARVSWGPLGCLRLPVHQAQTCLLYSSG